MARQMSPRKHVYGIKGGSTRELYRYDIAANSWQDLAPDTIPILNHSSKKRSFKKGSSLVFADDGKAYATTGGNTFDFWQHDPTGSVGSRWTQEWQANVPGAKACKEGVSAVAVSIGDPPNVSHYVYFLKGSGTYDFYRYDADAGTWATMASALEGVSKKAYKNGSSITYDGDNTIYCLKGNTNEFYAYSVGGNDWVTKEVVPGGSTEESQRWSGPGLSRRPRLCSQGQQLVAVLGLRLHSARLEPGHGHPCYARKNVNGGGALVSV